MATELSNTDKLREFVEELKRLNIQIVRPNINDCFADFKSEKNKIYYALSGIKSVGHEAISNLVEERENNGPFKSLNDFIKRVNPVKTVAERHQKLKIGDSSPSPNWCLQPSTPQATKTICKTVAHLLKK